jgi:O-antigen ligase
MLKFLVGVVMIIFGFGATLFWDPIWGLYFFSLLSHVRLEQLSQSYWLPLRVPIVIAVLTMLLYIVSPKYPQKFRKWPAEVWLFGLMVLGMALGSMTAVFNHDLAWTLTFDYLKYWIFFIMLIQMIDSKEKLDKFHWVMILSAVWLVYRAYDLRGTTGLRFENLGGGNVADSNHYSAALVILFPFVFQKTFSSNRRIAIGAAVLCFGMVMAILIAISRGGLLGLVALAILIFVNVKKRRFMNITILAAVGIIAFSFANGSEIERLSSIFGAATGESRDDSAQSRLDYWSLAYELFKEHPILGVGPGNFMYYSGYLVMGRPYGQSGQVTHSLWFELLSQGGLIVCVPFVIMVLRFFKNTRRIARAYTAEGNMEMALYARIPMIALAAFFVPATFLDRSVYEPMYWCIGLGVVHRYLFDATHPSRSRSGAHVPAVSGAPAPS